MIEDGALSAKLDKAGGTMTGALVLSGAPTVDLNPATKKYVDDKLPTFIGARLHKNSVDQALAGDTFAKVTFSTATFDTASWFDNANDRLTVAVTGKYRVSGQITYTSGIADGNLCVARVLVNGTGATRTNITSPGTADVTVRVDDVLELTAGDYVELQGFKGGSATNIYGSPNETFLNLQFQGT